MSYRLIILPWSDLPHHPKIGIQRSAIDAEKQVHTFWMFYFFRPISTKQSIYLDGQISIFSFVLFWCKKVKLGSGCFFNPFHPKNKKLLVLLYFKISKLFLSSLYWDAKIGNLKSVLACSISGYNLLIPRVHEESYIIRQKSFLVENMKCIMSYLLP